MGCKVVAAQEMTNFWFGMRGCCRTGLKSKLSNPKCSNGQELLGGLNWSGEAPKWPKSNGLELWRLASCHGLGFLSLRQAVGLPTIVCGTGAPSPVGKLTALGVPSSGGSVRLPCSMAARWPRAHSV